VKRKGAAEKFVAGAGRRDQAPTRRGLFKPYGEPLQNLMARADFFFRFRKFEMAVRFEAVVE